MSGRTVWKYTVPVDDIVTHPVPDGARIVHVHTEDPPVVHFCAEVDTAQPRVPRRFAVVGTGHPVPLGGTYIGTTVCARGALVWHLYELPLP